jgi:hypothetical protein
LPDGVETLFYVLGDRLEIPAHRWRVEAPAQDGVASLVKVEHVGKILDSVTAFEEAGLDGSDHYGLLDKTEACADRTDGHPNKYRTTCQCRFALVARQEGGAQNMGSRGAAHVADLIALTIAKMPTRKAGVRRDQDSKRQARSNPIAMVVFCSAPEFAPPDSVRYGFPPES